MLFVEERERSEKRGEKFEFSYRATKAGENFVKRKNLLLLSVKFLKSEK